MQTKIDTLMQLLVELLGYRSAYATVDTSDYEREMVEDIYNKIVNGNVDAIMSSIGNYLDAISWAQLCSEAVDPIMQMATIDGMNDTMLAIGKLLREQEEASRLDTADIFTLKSLSCDLMSKINIEHLNNLGRTHLNILVSMCGEANAKYSALDWLRNLAMVTCDFTAWPGSNGRLYPNHACKAIRDIVGKNPPYKGTDVEFPRGLSEHGEAQLRGNFSDGTYIIRFERPEFVKWGVSDE